MFKLLKLGLLLLGLTGLGYLAFFVQFGERSLYGHLVGISQTDEAQQLGEEIEQKADNLSSGIVEKVPELFESKEETISSGNKPLSQISDEDRTALSELLKQKNR